MQREKYIEALSKFTEAIDKRINSKKNAIYRSNRALAHIHLENYGLAIDGNIKTFLTFTLDANKAIEVDPNYFKAYFRRASAQLILGHYLEAIDDLKFLLRQFPNEPAIIQKLQKAKDERKKVLFREAIADSSRETGVR